MGFPHLQTNGSGHHSAVVRFVILALLTLVLALALAVPFVFETQTLWYKVGSDKTMLRGGQLAGMAALVFVFLQVLLGSRIRGLERAFGPVAVMWLHRLNGLLVLLLALVHVGLVLLPEGIGHLPLGWKYWPEMVGAIALFTITTMVIASYFRERLGLAYLKWRVIHRALGYLIPVLVVVHVLNVSESFTFTVPKVGLFVVLGSVAALVVQRKMSSR